MPPVIFLSAMYLGMVMLASFRPAWMDCLTESMAAAEPADPVVCAGADIGTVDLALHTGQTSGCPAYIVWTSSFALQSVHSSLITDRRYPS